MIDIDPASSKGCVKRAVTLNLKLHTEWCVVMVLSLVWRRLNSSMSDLDEAVGYEDGSRRFDVDVRAKL